MIMGEMELPFSDIGTPFTYGLEYEIITCALSCGPFAVTVIT